MFQALPRITKDTNITLVKDDGEVIATVVAYQDFKTLIISDSDLTTGTYYIYVDGEKTEYSKTIN